MIGKGYAVLRGRRSPLIEHKEHTTMKPKNTICLWFDKDADEAARFYAAVATAIHA